MTADRTFQLDSRNKGNWSVNTNIRDHRLHHENTEHPREAPIRHQTFDNTTAASSTRRVASGGPHRAVGAGPGGPYPCRREAAEEPAEREKTPIQIDASPQEILYGCVTHVLETPPLSTVLGPEPLWWQVKPLRGSARGGGCLLLARKEGGDKTEKKTDQVKIRDFTTSAVLSHLSSKRSASPARACRGPRRRERS